MEQTKETQNLPQADMLAEDVYGNMKEWYEKENVKSLIASALQKERERCGKILKEAVFLSNGKKWTDTVVCENKKPCPIHFTFAEEISNQEKQENIKRLSQKEYTANDFVDNIPKTVTELWIDSMNKQGQDVKARKLNWLIEHQEEIEKLLSDSE